MKILVPVDYSKGSDNACKFAIELARDMKAEMVLMHSFESTLLYSSMPLLTVQLDYAHIYQSELRKLKDYYKKITKLSKGVKVELNMQHGIAAVRIPEVAREMKAGLIIMGTTGKGALARTIIGSNTLKTIQDAPCLVLAIPLKSGYKKLRKIVYASDLTESNIMHATRIVPFIGKFKGEIMLLNVDNKAVVTTEADYEKIRVKIRELVKYKNISAFVLEDKNVAAGIHSFIEKHKADCLAVYTHHRGFIEGLFSTSMARKLSLHVKVPLLVIHEDDAPVIPLRKLEVGKSKKATKKVTKKVVKSVPKKSRGKSGKKQGNKS